jgi:hypothetical protein
MNKIYNPKPDTYAIGATYKDSRWYWTYGKRNFKEVQKGDAALQNTLRFWRVSFDN